MHILYVYTSTRLQARIDNIGILAHVCIMFFFKKGRMHGLGTVYVS